MCVSYLQIFSVILLYFLFYLLIIMILTSCVSGSVVGLGDTAEVRLDRTLSHRPFVLMKDIDN
jgi:hypothetical protein